MLRNKGISYQFITNNWEITAEEVALIYKYFILFLQLSLFGHKPARSYAIQGHRAGQSH